MADDFAVSRSTRIDQRRVVRGATRRAGAILIIAIGVPTPQSVTLPSIAYAQTLIAPAVQVSGNQAITLPTIDYAYTLVVPQASSSSAPPDIISSVRAVRISSRRVIQRGGLLKEAVRQIALAPGSGTITLPTLTYDYAMVTPYVIANPAMLYLGGDDGRWPPPTKYTRRVVKSVLLTLESGNQNIALPTLVYSYTLPVPAVQVSGSQSITLPTIAYTYTLTAPLLPISVTLPTLAYVYTLIAPVIMSDPVVAPCRVRAYRDGFFANQEKPVGAEFYITTPYQFSPYWMDFIDPIPSTWTPFIRTYVQSTDDAIQRAVDPREAAEWAATDEEPSGRPDD